MELCGSDAGALTTLREHFESQYGAEVEEGSTVWGLGFREFREFRA